ncbi:MULTISPECIES: hypothetical protein [Bacillus]|uniref:hypothetical protein n=1 Tax=Bacillus TaxID=1386 RepID=UPI00028F0460|nr:MULTISPECIES: hypothetical protein [Bacillus]EKF34353.1 hypothetical protein BA1_15699 [Bacillus xiamenensis]MCA0163274.1 hypothetical protein [Bacillus sp. RAR_M1_44]
MSKHVLKEFETLREAVEFIKGRLPEYITEFNRYYELFLLYSIDGGLFFVFESDYALASWLESVAWDDWGLWELNDPSKLLNEDVMIWQFHRDFLKEMFEGLYRDSKPFINGWSRQRKKIEFQAVPSFSLN